MDFQQTFSKNLRAKRKEMGMSQKQLAFKIGFSEKTVSKWESGKAMPSLEVFAQLCNILGWDSREALNPNRDVYYLGIDGGGTKTAFLLCDKENRVVETYTCGGCNPYEMGIERTKAVLKEGIAHVCKNIPYSFIRVFAGIAGGRLEAHRQSLSQFLNTFGFYAYDVGNDNDNLISVALGGQDGITVIMGTGFCIYQVLNGKKTQIGGFGYLFDEGGSGYHFGRDALSAMFAHFDGNGTPTVLSQMIEEKTGMSPRELLPKLYKEEKRYIASFSPLVFQAQKQNDPVAQKIVKRNLSAVATRLLLAQKGFPEGKINVVFAGGLTKEETLLPQLLELLPQKDRFHFTVLKEEIVCGAVRLAQKL